MSLKSNMQRRDFVSVLTLGASALMGCKRKDDGGDIIIGHYASLTGNTAHFGQDSDKAARVLLDEINARGGVKGRKIRLVTLDDRGDSAEAANAVARLIDLEGAVAVLGEIASSLSLAGGRIAQRRKVPMVSSGSTNPKVTQIGEYVFRSCFLDPFQGRVMAVFARQHLKLERVAILRDVRNDYSIGLSDSFRRVFRELGGTIVLEQSYAQGDTDFSAQITAIRAAEVQAIFTPGYYSEVAMIARTAQRLGLRIPLLGGDGWDAPDLFTIGGDAIHGSYFSNHFAPDLATPKASRFVEEFRRRHGQPPTGLGALGYDGLLVITDAIRRAASLDPEDIRIALTETRDLEGVTGTITIDADRNPKKSAVVLKIEAGRARYETTIDP